MKNTIRFLVFGLVASLFLFLGVDAKATPAPSEDVYWPLDGDQMITVQDGTPYTVPTGKQLLLLGLGATDWTHSWRKQDVEVVVAGQVVDRCILQWANPAAAHHPGTIDDVQSIRIPVKSGETVSVNTYQFSPSATMPNGRVWGILIPDSGLALSGSITEVPASAWGMIQGTQTLILAEGEMIVLTEVGVLGAPGVKRTGGFAFSRTVPASSTHERTIAKISVG